MSGYGNQPEHKSKEEEEQYTKAFITNGISSDGIDEINRIKKNDQFWPDRFTLESIDRMRFNNLSWELIGKYIQNNTFIHEIDLDNLVITNRVLSTFFKSLTRSSSITTINLSNNMFGVEGLRSMIPFIKNSPELKSLCFNGIDSLNTEGFQLLLSTLNTNITELRFGDCNIDDISSLSTCVFPNLQILSLKENYMGRDNIVIISNLLHQESSALSYLNLESTGIEDEHLDLISTSLRHNNKLQTLDLGKNNITGKGCQPLATSLKHNTSLVRLDLSKNNIEGDGHRAFLQILNDISSIDATFHSNHTLKVHFGYPICHIMQEWLDFACGDQLLVRRHQQWRQRQAWAWGQVRYDERYREPYPDLAQRKVIYSQLNSTNRRAVCRLLGVDYSPNTLFVDIKTNLLPNILALIGREHGQSELYTALIPTAPDLLSYVDRKAMIKDIIEKNNAKISGLTADLLHLTGYNTKLNKRLGMIDKVSNEEGQGGASSSGNKRQRSASF